MGRRLVWWVLAPGGWYEETWNAFVVAPVTLPAGCGVSDKDEACNAPTAPTAGTYEVSAGAAVAADCDPACVCEANSRGGCLAEETGSVEPTMVATAVWDGSCASIELRFEG